jgi:hypothetical protein
MLVGEIGIPRLEYLYDLRYWEILLITRGYFRRHHPGWEQARLIAYNAHYCMGSKQTPPTVQEWLPLPWEREPGDPLLSDDEVESLRRDIIENNKRTKKQAEQ